MKKVCLVFILLVSSTGFAHNKTVSESFKDTLPDALTEAALIDVPVSAIMWSLGFGSQSSILIGAVASAGAYSIRKTCNDYANEGKDWKVSALCGFAGGAAKYSGRTLVTGTFSPVEPILGAADAGTYEATSGIRGAYMTLELMLIEGGLAALGYVLKPSGPEASFIKDVKLGLGVGVLVSGAVYMPYTWYGQPVKAWIQGMLKPVPENPDGAKKEL